MYNPFAQINEAFAGDYCVNLRIVGLDGSIMLTLSDHTGITARHLIEPAQRNDPLRLQRVIGSIRSGLDGAECPAESDAQPSLGYALAI